MAHKPERRPALGRGLSALIPEKPAAPPAPPAPVAEIKQQPQREVDLDLIDPNPLQPRTRFDDAKLQELAESISSAGLVQPIVVRRKGERFEIVAGERRWRAAQIAGLLKLPVHVSDVSDEKLLQTALIENIQREDLNPIEEAQAYKRLGEESGLTQEQIAVAVGKDRASIANYLRLLRLPEQVRARVASGDLSMGHARALIGHADASALARKAADDRLSVREVERLARKAATKRRQPGGANSGSEAENADIGAVQSHLEDFLGMPVRIAIDKSPQQGAVTIRYRTLDQLDLLCQRLTGGDI